MCMAVIVAVSVSWRFDIERKNAIISRLQVTAFDYHERLAYIEDLEAEADNETVRILLFALADPYSNISKAAEEKLVAIASNLDKESFNAPSKPGAQLSRLCFWSDWYSRTFDSARQVSTAAATFGRSKDPFDKSE